MGQVAADRSSRVGSRLAFTLLAALALAVSALPSRAAAVPSPPQKYVIQPGRGLGPIVLGMTVATAQTVVTMPAEKIDVWIDSGYATRIRTTNPSHRTDNGFGPGQNNWEAAREELCLGASVRQDRTDGFEIHCPLAGLVLEVSDQVITAFVLSPPEKLAKTSFSTSSGTSRTGGPSRPDPGGVQKTACERSCRVQFVGAEMKPREGLALHFGVVYQGVPSYEPDELQGSYTVEVSYGTVKGAASGKILAVNSARQITSVIPLCTAYRRQGCVDPGFTAYSVTSVDIIYIRCRPRSR